ncbi:methyltransferase domain-containing protein [Candidatus Woesearchaeota archaeon]|nr:methyltransferase domain-containing protein [Candidatus Woesearchaeota archaeon]
MTDNRSVNKKEWDYTEHAKYYDRRPNYAPEAVEHLAKYVGAETENFIVADIGAGTGNLTVLIFDKAAKVFSVEPNAAMRNIGIEKTEDMKNVTWSVGTGEETGLADQSVNLAAFGSSFNCTDRAKTLKEVHRILKSDGWFTCMWNNRDLTEPTQKKVEGILQEFYPEYSHGTRREQQEDVILASRLFNNVYYFEEEQLVAIPLEKYIEAWRSVKNAFWDFSTEEGKATFEKIATRIRDELKDTPVLKLKYDTRVWVAKKID